MSERENHPSDFLRLPLDRRAFLARAALGGVGVAAAGALGVLAVDSLGPARAVADEAPPLCDPPTTDVPTTDAPTTSPPTTDVPSTEPPTTDVPTTDAPTTDPPTTDPPTTDPPPEVPAPDFQEVIRLADWKTSTASGGISASVFSVYALERDDFHHMLVVLPAGFDPSVKTRFIVHHHPASGDDSHLFSNPSGTAKNSKGVTKVMDSWLNAGWGVASLRLGTTTVGQGDFLGGSNAKDDKWGNKPCRDSAAIMLQWLARNYNMHDRGIMLFGCSAGAAYAVNNAMIARASGVNIAGIAVVDGAFNVRANYRPNPTYGTSAITTQIRDAYRLRSTDPNGKNVTIALPGDDVWLQHVDTDDWATISPAIGNGHDPMVMDLTSLSDLPVYFSASIKDGTVEKAQNSDRFNARLAQIPWTGPVTYNTATNGGHISDANFDVNAINTFIRSVMR